MAASSRLKIAEQRFRRMVEDPDYLTKLEERLKAGRVPAGLETLILHYAYGKPVDKIEVTEVDNYAAMSDEELRNEIRELESLVGREAPKRNTDSVVH